MSNVIQIQDYIKKEVYYLITAHGERVGICTGYSKRKDEEDDNFLDKSDLLFIDNDGICEKTLNEIDRFIDTDEKAKAFLKINLQEQFEYWRKKRESAFEF